MTGRTGFFSGLLWTLLGLAILGVTVVDTLGREGVDSGPVISVGEEERTEPDRPPASRLLAQRLLEAASEAGGDRAAFRRLLARKRVELNTEIINRVAAERLAWIRVIGRGLQLAALAGILLLLGPVWLVRKSKAVTVRDAWRTLPYFTVTAAAVVLLTEALCGIVLGIQNGQIAIAALGNVAVSTTDAVVHYLVTTSDGNLARLVDLLAGSASAGADNPFAGQSVLAHLWRGLSEAHQSGIFRFGGHVLQWCSSVVELYAPLLALVVLAVTLRIAVPVARNLIRYPADVYAGRDARSLGLFTWDQLKVFGREVRASFWMVLFILLFTATTAVLIRVLLYPLVVASLQMVLSAVEHVAAGGALPDLGVFVSLLSISLTLLACFCFVIVPSALVVANAYRVVRERLNSRRRFKQFPEFWRSMRGLLLRVSGLAIISLGVVLGIHAIAWQLIGATSVRVWLPAVMFAPLFLALVWRLRLLRRLIELARADVCALPPLNLQVR